MGMFRIPSPGDSISVVLRKLLKGGRRGSQATSKFATKATGTLNIKDQIEDFSILCMGRCKPLGSLNSYASQLSGVNPVSLFTLLLASFPSSSAITLRVAASAGLLFWESSFTFGGQKSLMAVTFLVY